MKSPIRFAAILACCGGLVFCGCGAPSGSSRSPSPLLITVQPSDETVPLTQSASFTVTVVGVGTISYQWSENGQDIPGTNSATYTTPPVEAVNSGDVFRVAVSDASQSETSLPAILTVGPRSPKSGDLRFQQVGSPTESNQGTDGHTLTFPDMFSDSAQDATESPLSVGSASCYPGIPHDCGWSIFTNPLPSGQTGLTAYFRGGDYPQLLSDIGSISTSSTVVTSLDLQPANSAYAAAWMQSVSASGFDLKIETVLPAGIQTAVATDAAKGRVVTAVSFDAKGGAMLLSYGWQGDTSIYDTEAVLTAPDNFEADAESLAGQGYIITACGGDSVNGFVLVGTKVPGDTMPRPIKIRDQTSPPAAQGEMSGYAPVGWIEWLSPSSTMAFALIYEQ